MIEEGQVKLADMRSSWGGAMGLTQFLPSEFYKYAVAFGHDGRPDIWHSVPDALASAAKQLVDKGWQPGLRWAYEVHAPKDVDCTQAIPQVTRPVRAWLESGYVPAYRRVPTAAELAAPASLLLPEGTYGPAFLTLANYYVIKEYNFSDLYVLFVGHLSERITDPRPFETPWSKNAQLHTGEVEAMQRTLTGLGIYKDKIDGKAGMLTRSALGAYQKANGLKTDCWPTAALLAHMQAGGQELNRPRPPHTQMAGSREPAMMSERDDVHTVSVGAPKAVVPMREGPTGSRRCAAAQQATRTGLTTHACHRLDHTC